MGFCFFPLGRDNLLPEQIAQIRDFEDQVNSLVAELETRAADEGHATLVGDRKACFPL